MEKVFEIYIRTTPERLWAAITDPDVRARFHFGNRIASDWSPGSAYVITNPNAPARWSRARTSRSTHHAGWSSPCSPCGARTSPRTGPPG